MADLAATGVMLRAIPFFQGLTQSELTALAPQFHIENFRRGELLAGRGFQRVEHYQNRVWLVCRGVVAAYTVTKQNTRKILFFLGAGKLLNHNVFDTKPNTILGEAMTDAMLLSIPRRTFAELVAASPVLTSALFAHYETDLWRMSHQLKNTAGYLSVERKLAIKLLKLSQDFGVPCGDALAISFPLTITQTAEFVGLPRETTSRACKKLAQEGLIRYENRRFLLLDRQRLVNYYREGAF